MRLRTRAQLGPGDVLTVRTPGLPGRAIRFGASLLGEPNLDNHVVVLHHKNGDMWRGIEARPGGVAWADANYYIQSPWTLSNVGQSKTADQRSVVTAVVEQMLKTSYDWDAIAQDALNDLHIPDLWAEQWHGSTPDHVVCSSLAAWAYSKASLTRPDPSDMAHCQPADWTEFILLNSYQTAAPAV